MTSSLTDYDRSVFINCPFDIAYQPLLRAITFAVIECDFIPNTALDAQDASEVRIQKIYKIIGSSRLSIHDLSRTQLDPTTKLPRFNMPLELGIFLGAKFLGDAGQQSKSCLVFDEKPYRYQAYLSDIAGQDITWHENEEKNAIFQIRDWLSHSSRGRLPSRSLVFDRYRTFQGELRVSCEKVRQKTEDLTHLDFVHHVRSFKSSYKETLMINDRERIENPNSEDIKRSVRRRVEGDEFFLILEKGATELSYIQAIRSPNEGDWLLEYQDGHTDMHYAATERVDDAELVRAFQNYRDGEEIWRTQRKWKRVEL